MDKEEILIRLDGLKLLAKSDFESLSEEDETSIDYVEGYLDAIDYVKKHFKKI